MDTSPPYDNQTRDLFLHTCCSVKRIELKPSLGLVVSQRYYRERLCGNMANALFVWPRTTFSVIKSKLLDLLSCAQNQNNVKYKLHNVNITHHSFLKTKFHMHFTSKNIYTKHLHLCLSPQMSRFTLEKLRDGGEKRSGVSRRVECTCLWCHGGRVAHSHQPPADSRHFCHSYETSFHCAAGDLPFIQPRKREGKEHGTGREGKAEKEEGGGVMGMFWHSVVVQAKVLRVNAFAFMRN